MSTTDSTAVTGDTRFEVGSVTKVLTSLLFARMIESGEVKLDDPIARFLPDSVSAPEYRGTPVTLRELATHSSSLPRLPTNIAPANMSDPYADYTADKLYAFLDSYDLPQPPDSRYEYSNLGAGLLGFLLSRRAGKPYDVLLEQRVLGPLGMKDSYVAEPGDSTDAHLARGHAEGKPVPFWNFGSLDGAGAVRSSTDDLLRLLRAELHPERTSMAKAIELSQETRFHASPELALALGWHVVQLPDSSSLYWHNGGTGGARSFVGFVPKAGAGVVVLMNEALPLDAVTQLGVQLARVVAAKEASGSTAGSASSRR
jgi:CubicO group peptidase (beta-lactamase class C family)